MSMSIDNDYQPAFPRSYKGGVSVKSDPKPCEICAMPTRAHCTACKRRICVLCTLRDAEQRCPECAT